MQKTSKNLDKMSQKNKKTRKFSFIRQFFRSFFTLICIAICSSCMIIICVFLWINSTLPSVDDFNTKVRTPSVVIQASDGTVIATYGDLYDDFVPVSELPPYVANAFLVVEDKRFYAHNGIDVIGLIRAAFINYRAHKVVQGGSTLTQQLAKNILTSNGLFSVHDRSIKRKLIEFILAIKLETYFSKEQILTLYLNRIYFGAGTYGIDAAARRYFQKSAKNLTLFEAAVLAGVLRAPSKYSPTASPKRAISRAKLVLERMEANQLLTSKWRDFLDEWEKDFLSKTSLNENGCRYFSDWIYEIIPSIIGPLDQDITVVTTLNMEMQRLSEKKCNEFYKDFGKEYRFSQAALISMTANGAILSMVGGMNYGLSQFNRATSAMRQPGSAFKTFVYLAALEEGIEPDIMIDDSPYEQGSWKPGNYKWKTLGEVSLFEGYVYSVNSVCIRLAKMVGIQKVAKVARRLGIKSHLNLDLTLALGSPDVTLLEMVTAYAPFANYGYAVWPYGIYEIRNKQEKILYQHSDEGNVKVIEDTTLSTIKKMMRAVVSRGTGRAANVDNKIFGKTGTSGHTDAMVVLCRDPVPDSEIIDEGSMRYIIDHDGLVLGVWIGNDSVEDKMAPSSTGGRIPTRIAGSLLKEFLKEPEIKPEAPESDGKADSVDNLLNVAQQNVTEAEGENTEIVEKNDD